MNDNLENVEIIDHTGDIGLKARAENLEQVFASLAKAMFTIICPNCSVEPDIQIELNLYEEDLEQLLVDWLSELNYYFQTKQFLLESVASIRIVNNSLEARVLGSVIDPQRHNIAMEIKAVTYHKIYVKKVAQEWRAQIIFDV
jgi:SHS2 domain-containing protein